MDVSLTTEQREFHAVARAFCERTYPSHELLRRAGSGEVPDLDGWRQMGEQLGLPGIGVPEPAGGFGGSLLDVAVVAEALGRVLAPVPFLSTAVLAVELLGGYQTRPRGCPVHRHARPARVAVGARRRQSRAGLDLVGCSLG